LLFPNVFAQHSVNIGNALKELNVKLRHKSTVRMYIYMNRNDILLSRMAGPNRYLYNSKLLNCIRFV